MSEADDRVERMANPDLGRDVHRHLERRAAAEKPAPVKPKVTRKRRAKRELTPAAAALCEVMGWDDGVDDKLAGGMIALGVLDHLASAGWGLVPIPREYE